MAIRHAVSGQPIDIRPLGERLAESRTVALFKAEELEVIRIVLPAGKTVPSHDVPGEITVQCLEGAIEVSTGSGKQTLSAGHLLYLSGGVEHSLHAVEDASVLVTILLRNQKERGERDTMTNKELQQQRLQAQLDQWKLELEGFKSKAAQASDEVKQELHLQLKELEKQIEKGKKNLATLVDTSDDAWGTVKEGVEASWKSLRAAFSQAAGKFKD